MLNPHRQTETGSIVVTPFPGAIETKPGSATVPFFGIEPTILNPVPKIKDSSLRIDSMIEHTMTFTHGRVGLLNLKM